MKKLLSLLLVWLLIAVPLNATILTGVISSPQTSNFLVNATLTFTINQAGVVAGSSVLSTSPVFCSTSVDGTIHGLPNTLVATVATPNYASGTVAAGTYYVSYTYWNTYSASTVEGLVGPATAVVLSGTGRILVTAPTLQPALATGYRVYVGTSPTALKLQATTTGWGSTTVSAYASGGAAQPAANTTVCSVIGNDTIIPSYTTYRVTAVSANGGAVPGFPLQFYLSGTTLDLTTSYPIATNVQARFPMPIIANPSSNATQSINSPLTLNGYSLTAGAAIFPDNNSPPVTQAGTGYIYNENGVLNIIADSVNIPGLGGAAEFICANYAGATADVKLQACIDAAEAAGGGVANAVGIHGAQTLAAAVTVDTEAVLLKLGSATYTYAGTGTAFAFNGDGSALLCSSPGESTITTTNKNTDGVSFGADQTGIYNCHIVGTADATGTGNGIELGGNVQQTATGNIVESYYHCLNTGGSGVAPYIAGNFFNNCKADGVLIADGTNGAKVLGNTFTTISSNCIDFGGSSNGVASGNVMNDCGDGSYTNDGHGILMFSSAENTSDVIIDGNVIIDSYDAAISIKAAVGYTVERWTITNNKIFRTVGQAGILVDGSGASAGTMKNGIISGNILEDVVGEAGILLALGLGSIDNIQIIGNQIHNTTGKGIYTTAISATVSIKDNIVLGSSGTAIDTTSTTATLVFCNRTTTANNYCPISTGFFTGDASSEIKFTSAGNTNLRVTSTGVDRGDFSLAVNQTNDFIIYDNDDATTPFAINTDGRVTLSKGATITGSYLQVNSYGIIVGAATAGDKGVGTINIAADIYKNNSAYTNPDYVFERAYTGQIVKFRDNPGATQYVERTIEEVELITRQTLRLPGMTDDPLGAFARADKNLELLEQAYLYIFQLNARIKALEARR